MKRLIVFLMASVMVFSFVLASFSTAEASSGWTNPTVTPLSGDIDFTTKILAPSNAPGTILAANGLIYPIGIDEGDRQFGGEILSVSGMDFGAATACFSFPTYSYGWRGSVSKWDGTKWIELVTNVNDGKEGTPSACATIYTNGTYGLLIGFDQALAPVKSESCAQDLRYTSMSWDDSPGDGYLYSIGLVFTGSNQPTVGDPFTWAISNQTPSSDYLTPVSGSGTVDPDWADDPYIVISDLFFSGPQADHSFTLRVYTPECHIINIVNSFR